MKLLIVEDERDLNYAMTKALRKEGYASDSAYDGEEALKFLHENEYDLVLLDLNLPKIDGIEVLKRIRETDQKTRVIIVSARSEIDDRVLGLNLGANDYVIKPFDFKELEARIRTSLRINYTSTPTMLVCGDISLDTNTKKVKVKDQVVTLTSKEFGILEYLMVHKDRLISNFELFTHVWEGSVDNYTYTDTLKFHIHTLKKKLSKDTGVDYIINKRNQGYRLRGADEEDQY